MVDKELGWIIGGALKSNGIEYDANEQGFRDYKNFVLDSKKKKIMVLGDSFVYGLYLPNEDTIPFLMEHKLKNTYDVFNLGMPGYGIDQMYLTYKKYAPVIKPDVIVLVFITDDVCRAIEAHSGRLDKPSFYIKHDKLVRRDGNDLNMVDHIAQRSVVLNILYSKIYTINLASSICKKIFSEMINEANARKEKFVVCKFPMEHEVINQRQLKEIVRKQIYGLDNFFKNNSVVYLDPTFQMSKLSPKEYKKFYLPDGHPSAEGNSFMANYIVNNCFLETERYQI